MLKKLLIGATALVLSSCSKDAPKSNNATPVAEPAAAQAPGFEQNDYADMANWLCHPDKASDACAIDLTATAIAADGTTSIIPFEPAVDPEFDCFYIYPTVSFDPTPNSDMTPGPEELNVVANQFARYGETCRLFAPIYRQRTLLELRTQMMTGQSTANAEMRYADVIDSWNTYMKDQNNGRGVVLIGHSQGAGMIYDMLKTDIVGSPDQAKLIAVHAIGFPTRIDPATGKAAGLPVCKSGAETGCLVNFESFRATAPPPADSRFGLADGDHRAVCNNPTELTGDGDGLHAFMPRQSLGRPAPNDYGVPVETPFVSLPDLLTATCEANETHDWLAISIKADPTDPRADDIPGDVLVNGEILADWGLHLVDMNLAMGNLVALAKSEGAAWQAAQTPE
ncbi:DUF3089 domain-containing protein [Hyphomonas sp.]|uniref:DUF3089 domain-containing protein n=1 Tax=Hyphomonas sp. TaxID=87 RepID=UPI003564A1F9